MREKLPDERNGVTLRFTILSRKELPGGAAVVHETKGYMQTGVYDDKAVARKAGDLGEIFIRVGKPGATEALLDQFAVAASIALQYGASVEELFGKFVGTRFEPSGAVRGIGGIDRCTSVLDLVARAMISRYGQRDIV